MKVSVESGMRFLYQDFIKTVESIENPKCTYVGEDKKSMQGGMVFEIPDDFDLDTALRTIKGYLKKHPKIGATIFRVIPTENRNYFPK